MKRLGWIVCLLAGCGTAPETSNPPAEPQEILQTPLTAMPRSVAAKPSCDLAGSWLLDVKIPVRWEATAQIDAGAGKVHLRATGQRKAAGNLLIDGWTPCGMHLPATVRKSGVRLRTKFPKAVFAQGAQTISPGITSIRSPDPGARFRMQPFALQYGAVIPNPTMAPWPESILDNAIDVDSDEHPGVTISVTTVEQVMARDPVTHLFVAWRVAVHTAGGKIDDCDTLRGLGVVPGIEGQLAVNVSVMGCAKRSGAVCSEAEADMAAAWLPAYIKDGNAKVTMTRLPHDKPGVCD